MNFSSKIRVMNPNIEGFEGASSSPQPATATPSSALKTVAIVFLALAIICVALALWGGHRQRSVQGPLSLAVLPDGQIWLSVDKELWRLNAKGQRLQTVSAAQAGLTDAADILMPHPDGYLAAWSRNSPTLHLLTADEARPVKDITPQWPSDLARHGDIAIHYAFAPDGRVAIAAGGGSAVALFDADGKFLARSPADTFHFTNGLWWANGGWWCTDTNRPALVRLNEKNLTEMQRVTLTEQQGSWRFLGLAMASRGEKVDGKAPLGVVERLGNNMERGHLVDVFPDGEQSAYPVPEDQFALMARDMDWLDDTLLVVDQQGFSIRQYSADRVPMDDWGDAAVQEDLAQRYAQVESGRLMYGAFLMVALLLFLVGLIVALLQRHLESRAKLTPAYTSQEDSARNLAHMKILPTAQLIERRLRAIWPFFVVIGVIMLSLLLLLIFLITRVSVVSLEILCGAMLAICLLVSWWARRHFIRVLRSDEQLANARALQLLKKPAFFWPLRQLNESPCETMLLNSPFRWLSADLWLVLTNQRLLMFRTNGFTARLHASIPRRALRNVELAPLTGWQRWWKGMMPSEGCLRFLLADGSAITGRVGCGCTAVAQRLVTSLRQAPVESAGNLLLEKPSDRRRARWQAFASFLIPGLGQWIQGRFGFGLLFFVLWLLWMGRLVHIAVAVLTPTREAVPSIIITTVLWVLFIGLFAAGDAWRMRNAPRE